MKFTEKDIEPLNQALKKWGINAQLDMIQEECIELALALAKLRRNGNMDVEEEAVIDEIADVIIMMQQAMYIFPPEMIEKRVRFKLDRLETNLLKNEN